MVQVHIYWLIAGWKDTLKLLSTSACVTSIACYFDLLSSAIAIPHGAPASNPSQATLSSSRVTA